MSWWIFDFNVHLNRQILVPSIPFTLLFIICFIQCKLICQILMQFNLEQELSKDCHLFQMWLLQFYFHKWKHFWFSLKFWIYFLWSRWQPNIETPKRTGRPKIWDTKCLCIMSLFIRFWLSHFHVAVSRNILCVTLSVLKGSLDPCFFIQLSNK